MLSDLGHVFRVEPNIERFSSCQAVEKGNFETGEARINRRYTDLVLEESSGGSTCRILALPLLGCFSRALGVVPEGFRKSDKGVWNSFKRESKGCGNISSALIVPWVC